MANATSTQLQELYVAYFGRAADPTGLDYWKESGITTAAFAANMYAQPEFKSVYGSLSIESQVNQIYKNLFDREADVAGLTYWTQQIKLGKLQLAEIANDLVWAAQNNSGSSDDKTALTNRTKAAEAYTAKVKESTSAILAFQPLSNGLGDTEFSAGANITLAKTYLAGIDKDTTFTAAGIAASVASIVTNGVPATTKSYTLTDKTDTFIGGSGKDVFQGVVVKDLGTGTTVTSGDSIDGGAGDSDVFNISVTGASSDDVSIVGVNADVEKIFFSNFDTFATATKDHFYDATLSNGLTTVGLSSSAALGDTHFTNLQNIVNAEMRSGKADLTLTIIDTAVAGTSDAATVTFSAQTAGVFAEGGVAAGGLEILNVVSEGSANTVDITSTRNSVTTINISGDQDLTTTVTSDKFNKIDASAYTGKLALTFDEAVAMDATGGSGDDKLIFSGDNFTTLDKFDGGAGTDTLSIASAITAATDLKNVTNVEVLEVTGANNVTLAADANVMTFDFTATTDQQLTLSTGVTGAVVATIGNTGDDDIVNSANVSLTVKGLADHIDDQDLLTGGTGTDIIEITPDTDAAAEISINIAAGNITNFDKILVIDNGDETTGSKNLSGLDIELTTGSYATALTIDASALDAANLDSNADGTIDSTDASEEVLILDGSSATAVLTVTGGAGTDTITTGTKNDVIDGGAGNDTITSTGGDDNVKGGAGDDKFIFGAGLTKDDVVDGGAGTDTLSVTTLVAANLAGVTNVETLAFTGNTTLDKDLSFDTIDLTDGSNIDTVTFNTGYTKATTVKIDAGDDAINSAKIAMTVTAAAGDLESADNSVITGSSSTTNDSMTITAESSKTVATSSRITNVDSITVADVGDNSTGSKLSGADFTIDLTSYGTELTIDASALDAPNRDADADGKITKADPSAEILTISGASSKALTVTGGGAADVIAASADAAKGDTISGGDGDDTFNFADKLTYEDTVDGGAGTDVISVTGAQSDVNFMKVTNVETISFSAGGATSNAFGAYFTAAGITKVNLEDDIGVSTVNASGATQGITFVATGTLNEAVTAGLGDDFLSVTDGQLTHDDTFDGGSGTDTITIDNSGGTVTAEVGMKNVKNIEKIVVKDADGGDTAGAEEADAIKITIDGDGGVLESDDATDGTDYSVEIDASAITDAKDAVTIIASDIAEKDFSFTFKTGAGKDDVTGSDTVDTITTGGEIDIIDAKDGDDTIDAGAGNDLITGGAGKDTMTGGSGDDDFLIGITDSTSALTKSDVITDFTTGEDEIRVVVTTANATYDFTDQGSAPNVSEGIALLSSAKGQYLFNTTTNQIMMDSDGNGLLQSGDFAVTLTGVTALADSDVAFDITMGTGAGTITTGAGADTVKLYAQTDSVTTGKGDDSITIASLDFNGTAAFGAGTDTLSVTHASADIAGATVTGLETITLAANTAVDVTEAQLDAFNNVANFTITGTSGGTETIVVAGDTNISAEDFSSIVYTNVATTINVDHKKDVIKAGTALDTFVVATTIATASELNLDAGGGAAVDVLDINTTDPVVLDAGTITGFETLDLDAVGVVADLTLDAAQFNAFTTITATTTDVINVTEIDAATVAGSAGKDLFTFVTASDDVVISAFTTAGADKLVLGRKITKVAVDGSSYQEQAVGAIDCTTDGFIVMEGDVANASATMDAAAMGHANGPLGGSFTGIGGNNTAYLMFKEDASDATTDAFIYYVTANNGGTAFASVDLIATIKSSGALTDPAFAAANFGITEA